MPGLSAALPPTFADEAVFVPLASLFPTLSRTLMKQVRASSLEVDHRETSDRSCASAVPLNAGNKLWGSHVASRHAELMRSLAPAVLAVCQVLYVRGWGQLSGKGLGQ